MRNTMMAITAILALSSTLTASAQDGRRGDVDAVGLYNFTADVSFVITNWFPEGPIGDESIIDPTYFPEGPIGVTGHTEADLVSALDGVSIIDGFFHGDLEATLDRDREDRLTLAGVALHDDVQRSLQSGRDATVQMTLTCKLDDADLPMPTGLRPGETGDYDCEAAIDGVDAGQLTSLLCAVGYDVDEAGGFGSDDFLREFDSDGDLIDDEVSRSLSLVCGM